MRIRKLKTLLILAAIISTAWAAAAHAAYPLPLRTYDGQACFPKERCPDPWTRYRGRPGGYFAQERGWHCEARNRFCWTEGLGHGCACSRKTPSETDWARTRLIRGRPNYKVEVRTYVINPCLVGLAKRIGLYDPRRPRRSRELMRRMIGKDLEKLTKGIRTMMSVHVPLENRRQLYSFVLAVCLRSPDMVK